ncbi:MAG TPA: hypothetical protein VIO38_14860 [Rariglobus sp.]
MNPARSAFPYSHSMGAFALTALLVLAATTAARSATSLVDDQFLDGGVTNGTDASDAAWTSLSNTSLTVGAFNSTGNTSDALRVDSTATFSGTRGAFTNASALAIGEAITVSLDFRITNTPGNNNAGLRFGLSSSSNTYAFTFGTGTTAGAGIAQFGTNTVGGTNTIYTASGSSFAINDTASHTFSFTLTRTSATSLSFLGIVDSNSVSAVTSNSISNFTFTSIVLGQGGTTNDFNIDNVIVTQGAIPEPSTYAVFAGLAVLGLVAFKRTRAVR